MQISVLIFSSHRQGESWPAWKPLTGQALWRAQQDKIPSNRQPGQYHAAAQGCPEEQRSGIDSEPARSERRGKRQMEGVMAKDKRIDEKQIEQYRNWIKDLIEQGKGRGYVTYKELNQKLPCCLIHQGIQA